MLLMRIFGILTFLQVDKVSLECMCVIWGLRLELGTRVLTTPESTKDSSAALAAE